MLNNILEISEKTSGGGKTPIKIALLKIHENPEETNKNGIHWEEEYVLNAIDSAKLMPICAEFITEEKDIPHGHGLTGTVINEKGISEPQFLNSETVGSIESASIETIKENDVDIKVLCGNGYLYNQRYPNFVKWVRNNHAIGKVDTSIEITGLPQNDNKIIYKEENPTDKFRTPVEYLFSGTAIISVAPADESAVILEVAQKKESNKEEQTVMEFNMNEVKEVIQSTITELNNKENELNVKVTELNQVIAEKDAVIAERDNTIVELNATVEQVQKALDDLKKEHESYWAEREALEKELGKLKAEQRLGELNSAIENFSDEEKKYAEVEINSFNENPMEGNIDVIVNKIYAGIGLASKKATEEARVAEINSAKEIEVEDIFSEMCSVAQVEEEEDLNIF